MDKVIKEYTELLEKSGYIKHNDTTYIKERGPILPTLLVKIDRDNNTIMTFIVTVLKGRIKKYGKVISYLKVNDNTKITNDLLEGDWVQVHPDDPSSSYIVDKDWEITAMDIKEVLNKAKQELEIVEERETGKNEPKED